MRYSDICLNMLVIQQEATEISLICQSHIAYFAIKVKTVPSEIIDEELFVKLSESAIECRVRRAGDHVKLKLRTPRKLYTMKVASSRAEEVIKRLVCEVVEV